jgi:hypothetical protein
MLLVDGESALLTIEAAHNAGDGGFAEAEHCSMTMLSRSPVTGWTVKATP